MLLKSTSQLLVVHPTLSLTDMDPERTRVATEINRVDFDCSVLDQIDESYDLLLLDWGLERPDARGVLDAFQQNAPATQILVLADSVPADDPVDRGADELLVGPVSDETLYSTIDRILLQKAYDSAMDEFFRLSTERALLESELRSGLDVVDRYQSIIGEIDDCRKRVATIRNQFSSEEFNSTLRKLLDE
ncbi:HalX domain-containing protein [Natronorubrum sp. DTA28]|uniref:HalX domain-containing protein n=1 Tax=Natronorubrum sp. DTA28 TaxID=3447019 RepID=UPI003F855767